MRTSISFLLLMLSAHLCFGQQTLFEHRIPRSIQLKPIQYGKNQTLVGLAQDSFLICLNGVLRDREWGNTRQLVPKRGPLSSDACLLWFLDDDGNLMAEKTLPGFCFVETVGREPRSLFYLVTRCDSDGNDYVSQEFMLFGPSGKISGSYANLNGRVVLPSFHGDGLALCYLDASGFGIEFELVPLSSLLKQPSDSKTGKGDRPRSITIRFKDHPPDAFLYLGGPDMDYVVAFGGTIWRESAVTRQVRWKVDDIGAGIQGICTADGITLDVDTEKPGLVVLDAETGAHVAALDASSPALRGHGVYFYTARYEKGRFIFTDYRRGRKQILDPDTGEIRTEPLPAMRSDDTGMSVRTADGRTLRLEVVDDMVRLLSVAGTY